MKAMVVTSLGDPEVLQMMDLPVPEPGPGQVGIRVMATSVNFADVKARRGQYHGAGRPPFIPGLDVAGVVDRVGHGVSNLSPGMRVFAFPQGGSYAEYVVADEALVFALPQNIDWDMAAALPTVALTTYALLTQVGNLMAGESVLVHAAAGGVGTTAIQLARVLGASQIIGVVSRAEKVRTAQDAGADLVIDTSQRDFVRVVLDTTKERGVDVVLDSIGGTVSEASLQCLAHFGRLVHFGSASGQPGHIQVSDLHATCRSVRGFSLGTVRSERPALVAPLAASVLELVGKGKLTMCIGRRYSLAEAANAHRWMESRESIGKIILTM